MTYSNKMNTLSMYNNNFRDILSEKASQKNRYNIILSINLKTRKTEFWLGAGNTLKKRKSMVDTNSRCQSPLGWVKLRERMWSKHRGNI